MKEVYFSWKYFASKNEELKGLRKHLKFIFIDEELELIIVKTSFKEIKKDIPYFTKKDLINAINYFNLHLKEVEFILSIEKIKPLKLNC